MRALVLGATGFIGGQIARDACEAGLDVHGLRRRPAAVGAIEDLPITWHTGDLEDQTSLQAAMQACDILFHAAGYAPQAERNLRRVLHTGVRQMRNVLTAALHAGVSRVIYTSSLSTIGHPPATQKRLADERDAYLPGSTGNPYYEVKWAMEHEALRAVQKGLPVIILCPTAVFGPGDVKPSTSQILLELARGHLPVAVDITTNIIDGRDVALAHIRSIEAGTPGERIIIGGHNLSIPAALRQAAGIAGVREPAPVLPVRLVRAALRLGDLLRLPIPATMRALPYWQPYNCKKGWDLFNITPRPYEDTVRDTLNWFTEHGYLT